MAPNDLLTAAEVADIMAPSNHPERLSTEELDLLTAHLSMSELEEVVRRIGLEPLARQLPPIFAKLLRASHRISRESPPRYDYEEDAMDDLLRGFVGINIPGSVTFIFYKQLSLNV
jgi:hypothetical protein